MCLTRYLLDTTLACNSNDVPETKPDYLVRKSVEKNSAPEIYSCPCCGSEMKPEQILEKSTVVSLYWMWNQ